MSAIERLEKRQPTNFELRQLLLESKLRINKRSVALEAGRAYALLFRPSYADISKKIEAASSSAACRKPASSDVLERQMLKQELKAQMEEVEQNWFRHVEVEARLLEQLAIAEQLKSEIERLKTTVQELRIENSRLRASTDGQNIARYPRSDL